MRGGAKHFGLDGPEGLDSLINYDPLAWDFWSPSAADSSGGADQPPFATWPPEDVRPSFVNVSDPSQPAPVFVDLASSVSEAPTAGGANQLPIGFTSGAANSVPGFDASLPGQVFFAPERPIHVFDPGEYVPTEHPIRVFHPGFFTPEEPINIFQPGEWFVLPEQPIQITTSRPAFSEPAGDFHIVPPNDFDFPGPVFSEWAGDFHIVPPNDFDFVGPIIPRVEPHIGPPNDDLGFIPPVTVLPPGWPINTNTDIVSDPTPWPTIGLPIQPVDPTPWPTIGLPIQPVDPTPWPPATIADVKNSTAAVLDVWGGTFSQDPSVDRPLPADPAGGMVDPADPFPVIDIGSDGRPLPGDSAGGLTDPTHPIPVVDIGSPEPATPAVVTEVMHLLVQGGANAVSVHNDQFVAEQSFELPSPDDPAAYVPIRDALTVTLGLMQEGGPLHGLDLDLAALYLPHSQWADATEALWSRYVHGQGEQSGGLGSLIYPVSADGLSVVVELTAKDGNGAALASQLDALGFHAVSAGAIADATLPVDHLDLLSTLDDLAAAHEGGMAMTAGGALAGWHLV